MHIVMYDSFLTMDDRNYGVEKETAIRETIDGVEYITFANDVLMNEIFTVNHIEDIANLHLEVRKLKKQRYNLSGNEKEEITKKIKELQDKMKTYINGLYFEKEHANIFLKQLKAGRVSAKNLSDILLLHRYKANDFTQAIVDEIRDKNLTIIQYKRKGKIFCVSADPNVDDFKNLDVLKYTLDKKQNNDDLYIKNYTHGTWGDINDLTRSGYYENREQFDQESHAIKDNEREHRSLLNDDYKAFFNSRNLFTKNDEKDERNDIFIINNNHPHKSLSKVPSLEGMQHRGEKSAKVFNYILKFINDYSAEKKKKLKKNIITTGVSNGNIHMLNSMEKFSPNLLEQQDSLSIDMESIPSCGIFTANPKTETAELFIKAIFQENGLYNNINTIKIETNLLPNYHPLDAPERFLEGVYKYFINNDNISLEQLEEFHNKLSIQPKLKDKCEEVYKKAHKQKEKMLSLTQDEQKKETELEGWRLAVYIALCITIIGALSYWAFQSSQYKANKEQANLLHIDKKVELPPKKTVIPQKDIKNLSGKLDGVYNKPTKKIENDKETEIDKDDTLEKTQVVGGF